MPVGSRAKAIAYYGIRGRGKVAYRQRTGLTARVLRLQNCHTLHLAEKGPGAHLQNPEDMIEIKQLYNNPL